MPGGCTKSGACENAMDSESEWMERDSDGSSEAQE